MNYEGKTHQAPSGQWTWVISDEEGELMRGAGYESEEDAIQDMYNELEEQRSRL